MTGPLAVAASYVRRAHARLPAFYNTRIQQEGLPDIVIRLRNVSRSGFMGETEEPIKAGSELRLTMPFGSAMVADVRWCDGNRIGCEVDGRFSNWQLVFVFVLASRHIVPGELRMAAVCLAAIATIGLLKP